jgi:dolichol-phosphate mannosyltransferase
MRPAAPLRAATLPRMHDEAVAVELTVPSPGIGARVRGAMRRPANWFELMRFATVGGSGYAINLATFTVLVHLANLNFRVAATLAFLLAVTNNFVLNRHWTFRVTEGRAHFQALRFFTISVIAFLFNLGVLEILVTSLGMPEVPAQALAIAAATPLSFLGNKLWTFRA